MIPSTTYLKTIKDIVASNIGKLTVLRNKTIMITGCTGLIGSAVADIFLILNKMYFANNRLILAARNSGKVSKLFGDFMDENIVYLPYSLEDEIVCSSKYKVDYVIHAASTAHPSLYAKEPVETIVNGIIGMKNILDFAKGNDVSKVLYISSSEVYGIRSSNNNFKEDDYGYINFLNARASYPSMKRACETLCKAYLDEYGVKFTIVRPGHIYGPTQKDSDSRAAAQFLNNAINKENIVLKSSGLQLRSYCHVLDCSMAVIFALLFGRDGEAYNVSNKDSIITIKEFASICAEISEMSVVFSEASLEEKKGYNMMNISALDATKLERLGWIAMLNPYEGIKNSIDCMYEVKCINDDI